MDYQYLLCDLRNRVLHITINREEKLNALSFELLQEIEHVFGNIPYEARVVILRGKGDKSFVAGADIKEIAQLDGANALEVARKGQAVFQSIEDLNIPVIAAINGYALGGGCELAMACHIRYASENAVFAQPEINLGIIPGYGGTQRLPKIVGASLATEMMLTGMKIGATEAQQKGLVSKVVPLNELDENVERLAQAIAAMAKKQVSYVLSAVRANLNGLDYEAEAKLFAACTENEAFKEGTTAFFEKRKPNFN